MDYFKDMGKTNQVAKDIQLALKDAALVSCSNSQAIEKLNAHIQAGQNGRARKAATVQRETYIMVVRTAHASLKNHIELDVLGKHRHKARCLMA